MTLARVGAGCDIRHVCVNLMAAGAATPAYGHILYHRARPVRDVASGASQIRYVSILIDTQRPATHARSATFPHDRFVHPEREHLSSLRLRPRAEARRPTAARPRQHSAASKPQADHDRAQRRGRRERAWPTTPAPTSLLHPPPPITTLTDTLLIWHLRPHLVAADRWRWCTRRPQHTTPCTPCHARAAAAFSSQAGRAPDVRVARRLPARTPPSYRATWTRHVALRQSHSHAHL